MSGASNFRPDLALVAAANAALDGALARGTEGPAYDDLFEAVGRLVALGEREAAVNALSARADVRAAAERSLARDEAEAELEDAALSLRRHLDALDEGVEAAAPTTDDAPEATLVADIMATLAVRDRAEFRLLGAALALDLDPDRVEAGAAGRLEFEALLRPELFRLCTFNTARREALAALAPAFRARFWWHYEGADLDPGAVAALPAVAALVATFPAAGERLASLVHAHEAWASSPARVGRASSNMSVGARASSNTPVEAHASAPALNEPREPVSAPVEASKPSLANLPLEAAYTLRDWVERRPRRGSPEATSAEALPLAAAPDDESVLIDDADYQISWSPPAALIVDLVADRRPGVAPILRLGDGTALQADPVEGAVERFAFSLPARVLYEIEALLILPFERGPLALLLPPGGRAG